MSNKDTSFTNIPRAMECNGKWLDFERTRVMGILNITPDSFYDGGKYDSLEHSIEHCGSMLEQGADIIDIGAFSSRPGAKMISPDEEKHRLLPVLQQLTKKFPDAIFSVDTFRSEIARMSYDNGASMINDISGGEMDDKMFKTMSEINLPYVLMHMNGKPDTMQISPISENAVDEVRNFFEKKVNKLMELGFGKVILDPGFGFGKSLESNYELLKNQDKTRINDLPTLSGISRKSMINKVLNIKPEQALNGTIALNTIAMLNGANILRVHDIKETVELVRLVEVYKNN